MRSSLSPVSKACGLAMRLAIVCTTAVLPTAGMCESTRMLPVPAVTIYPGDNIAEASLVQRAFPAQNAWISMMIAARDDAVGKVARRTLPAGSPIPIGAVRAAHLVTRGQSVTLVYKLGALTITASGLALQPAGDGERLAVRNSDSGRTVHGFVQADQTVLVENK